MARKRKTPSLSEKAGKARELWMDTIDYHDRVEEKVRNCDDAFDGVLRENSNADDWNSKLHPPYVNHIVETTLASLIDDEVRFQVLPRGRLQTPEEAEMQLNGARAHELLHRAQMDRDRFGEKLRPLALQALIRGFTAAKTFWKQVDRPVRTSINQTAGTPAEGNTGRLELQTVFDQPTTEVVDVRDLFMNEAAVETQRATVIAHRLWMSFPELKALEASGFYENVDEVRNFLNKQKEEADRLSGSVDMSGHDRDRAKNMIEVMEIWWREDDGEIWVVTLGGREIELRAPSQSPFNHGEYPFVIGALQPKPFQITSLSQVAKIAHMQDAVHDIMNQRHDNLALINNLIVGYDPDVEDANRYKVRPGAKWPNARPDQIWTWQPNPIPAEISIGAEQMLLAQMQNVAGSQPFTSTSEARVANANTATEAAILGQIAQSNQSVMKSALFRLFERIGQQRTELNVQFVTEPLLEREIGLDDEEEIVEITPEMLRGDYLFDVTPMNESLMRQERRAEANAKLQLFSQAAQVFAAMGVNLNAKRFLEDWLLAYDIEATDAYISATPAQPPGPGGQPGAEGGAPAGVTGENSINPAVSPSSNLSVSPETLLQRAQASAGSPNGGAQNV